MRSYWDSSAIVKALHSTEHRALLDEGEHWTRPHSLAETFSALTGGTLGFKTDADDAAAAVADISGQLQFVELTAEDTLAALHLARRKGVQGGRVHDLLHVAAAEKCGAERILTRDQNDFAFLTGIPLEKLQL